MAVVGGLQKARVARQDLPPLSVFPDGSIGHYVRYRIISEDRNRYSHWSPTYAIKIPNFSVIGDVQVSFTDTTVTAVWGDALDRPSYDVFVRWGNSIKKVGSTGTTRTIETHITPGFAVGDMVYISGVDVNYNGTHEITEVDTVAKTVKFVVVGDPQTQSMTTVTADMINANYYYHGTPSVHTYSFLRLPNFDRLHVDIQVESIDKQYALSLLVYDSTAIALT